MNIFRNWLAKAGLWLGVIAVATLTGCASHYVDGATKEMSSAQFKKTNPLHPVQVLFEFQTKGVANAQATAQLKAGLLSQVKDSGVFSAVSETPVEGGAMLSITLNNVPLTDDVFSKGFMTGLTFGLAGSQVSDGYVCTAKYTGPAGSAPIVKQARHAIHTTMGAAATPGNATKAANITDAVTTMQRQVVSNVLNDVTNDANFK
jgi:hypothetical protein